MKEKIVDDVNKPMKIELLPVLIESQMNLHFIK